MELLHILPISLTGSSEMSKDHRGIRRRSGQCVKKHCRIVSQHWIYAPEEPQGLWQYDSNGSVEFFCDRFGTALS